MSASISFREVIPKNLGAAEWIEVNINTGTQITLQDIKTFEKSGGYCFKNVGNVQTRNRFIYWRTYQDVLELSDVSLDVSLVKNHLRLRFTDSAVLNVSLIEEPQNMNLLVVTVSSVHRFVFPIKSEADGEVNGTTGMHPQSIFCDVNEKTINPTTYCVDGFGTTPNNLPHVANSYISHMDDASVAYFAVAYPTKLMLHVMNCDTGSTTSQEVKEAHLMPRFLSNLKGALIGRTDAPEAPLSMAFSQIEDEIYLLVLYRSNELRLWSVNTMQPVSSINCSGSQDGMGAQGPQTNVIRKIDEQNFCIFLSLDMGAEFVGVSILSNPGDGNGRATLARQHTVPAPQMDLADFDATSSHIWALWSNAEGDFNVSAYFLCSNAEVTWVSAALEPPPDRYCLTTEQGVDPREAYCSYIFHPGRFDRNVIAKALYMFRRVNMQFDVKQLSMSILKEQVCQAVEDEIQNELKEIVVSDEEYTEIATRLWDRFYSCCEQYHIKFSEPTGLAVLPSMDAVCIVRRQSFAFLRPCEMLEHLMLIGEHIDASFLAPYCRNNSSVAVGFVKLMKIVTQLEKLLSEDIKMELDKKLYQREPAFEVVNKMLKEMTVEEDEPNVKTLGSPLIKQMLQVMQDVPDMELAINMLLDVLRMVNEDSESQQPNYFQSMRYLLPTGALFGSEYGLSVLAETVKQIAMIRFSVCRNLLMLQCIYYGEKGSEKRSIVTNINFLNSYYALVWIAETPISMIAPAGFEASVQRLTMAQLFDGYTRPYSNSVRGLGIGQTTLLWLFLQSKGLFAALSMLLKSSSNPEAETLSLRENLLQLVGFINQMLWPDAPNYIFPEWLFGTCHHVIIQDYVRILSSWCEEKSHSRLFMLAVSLLDCGEPHKAVFRFEEAASGVLKEPFLFEHVLKHTPLYNKLQGVDEMEHTTEDRMQAMVHYYLKVIQLFHQHSALDYIIQLANMAMTMLLPNDPQLPMFQSIIFNNHLQLGHYEEAYHALVHNADTSRRKDCLRQLVIALLPNKGLDLLMQFPYTGLQDEFESIVESRARSISIDQNEVYNFLYAFHVNKGNMRKAATVMYEQAMRLLVDYDTPNALQKRCFSLLVCINCLHLVDHRYRWIAKPTIGDERVPINQDIEDDVISQEVVVLELEDIQRELLLAEALREFTSHRPDAESYEQIGAEELSYLLATSGLYTAALKLTRGYDFSVLPIFECLTAACVMATEDKTTDAWSWLQKNDLADLPHRNNAADMAWALLQKLVVDNELDASTSIRKAVVSRLLTLNVFVPQWLHDSYKLANSRELLQLFVKHNRLLEAADMACEMISAMLGAGSEYFDFAHSVNVKNPQLAFPINTIDLLLHGLRENGKDHIEYEMARVKVEDEVFRYTETVKRTTEDKMKLAILQNREDRQQQMQLNR